MFKVKIFDNTMLSSIRLPLNKFEKKLRKTVLIYT